MSEQTAKIAALESELDRVRTELQWLSKKFNYYTECAMATQQGSEMRKSTPKSELVRFTDISNGMVAVAKALTFKNQDRTLVRLHELLHK